LEGVDREIDYESIKIEKESLQNEIAQLNDEYCERFTAANSLLEEARADRENFRQLK
jgi:hypothetical protein